MIDQRREQYNKYREANLEEEQQQRKQIAAEATKKLKA